MAVTEPRLDLWRPSVAVCAGKVVVAWSQNFDGEWDLCLRSYDPASRQWSKRRRIERPGADIHVRLAATPDGSKAWLVWQGWTDGNFDILAQPLEQAGRAEPVRLSETPANEWTPEAAADSKGTLYVVYDSYRNGNYDVYLNIGLKRTVAVAETPRFEARPHLAIDKRGRVWIAYEEGDPNWGKDFGTRWPGPSGVPFYLYRTIAVRVWAGGKLLEPLQPVPVEPVSTRYGDGKRKRASLPRLAVDRAGRIWLTYRRHALLSGAGTLWASFATYYSGGQWSPVIPVPYSNNVIDNRPPFVLLPSGQLALLHSTDYRRSGERVDRNNDLWATVLPAGPEPPAEPKLRPAAVAKIKFKPIHPNESADVARIRKFRVTVGGKTYRLFRGEFHRHTEFTSHRDQDGLFESLWRYGLDVARMDWLGPGDHDNGYGREYPWWLTQKQVDIYHHPPTFVPMFTYERSVRYPSGHRNPVFARRGIRPLPRLPGQKLLMGQPDTGSPDVKILYAYLKHFGGVCASHTSATNMGTDWRDNDPEVEPVVEIYQGCRQNYEHAGAPLSAKGPGDSVGGYQPAGFVWNALKKGYRLGFQSSSDHVSTHLSYAVLLVEEPTREGVLDALRRRHSYGAMDNIIVVFTSGEHLMGDQFQTAKRPEFEVQAIGTDKIARVVFVRAIKGEVPKYVYETRPNSKKISLRWVDTDPVPNTPACYYVRIEQSDGKLAWASPMWITYRP